MRASHWGWERCSLRKRYFFLGTFMLLVHVTILKPQRLQGWEIQWLWFTVIKQDEKYLYFFVCKPLIHVWQIKNDCWPRRSNATANVRIQISAKNAHSQVTYCSENHHSVFKFLPYKEGDIHLGSYLFALPSVKFLPCKYAIFYQWQRLEVCYSGVLII